MAKAALKKKKKREEKEEEGEIFFHIRARFKFKEENIKLLRLERRFVRC
jgi:hypothetical protein